MSIQVAREELSSLTDFQREIHMTSGADEGIISDFYKAFVKSTWYSSVPKRLKCTTDGEEVVYTVSNSFHFLQYSYLRTTLPAIRVKPEYRGRVQIAWCHNPGTNITKQACFREDDDTFQSWDHVWADMYFQFYQKAGEGMRDNHNRGVGNVPCLEEWSESLPAYPINVDQPWFYSMDRALAFPIFYKNSQTRAEHRYSFRRKVGDLLRMRVLSGGKWKDATKGYRTFLDMGPSSTLREPELWGRYAYISEPELKWFRCMASRTLYIRDVRVCDTSNPQRYDSTIEVALQGQNPCLALFWVAENQDSVAVNNHSNYTTDSSNIYRGTTPIRHSTLKHGSNARFEKMAPDHFSIAECRKHFPSAPNEPGYQGHSFASDSTSFHGDIGLVFQGLNSKLEFLLDDGKIQDSTPRTEEEEEIDPIDEISPPDENKEETPVTEVTPVPVSESTSPSFLGRVRLLVLRKFTIKGEEGKYEFSVV